METCRERTEDEKYAPISVEDYVRQKYRDGYGRVGIYKVAEKTALDERRLLVGEEGRLDRTVTAAVSGVQVSWNALKLGETAWSDGHCMWKKSE